jgi:ribosomal protein S18 acetylase RimI-like enzyme
MPALMAARTTPTRLPAQELDAIERNSYEAIQPGVVQISDTGDAWIVRAPGPPGAIGYSRAAVLRFESIPAARDRVDELRRDFHAEGRTAAFAVAHGVSRPDELTALLAERGLAEIEREVVLWIAELPPIPHLDPGLRIEQVTADTAPAYVDVEAAAFGIPPGMAVGRLPALRNSLSVPGRRAYLVSVGRRYVATTRLAVVGGLASLTSVGVLPEERGRGYGRLVTAVATRAGLAAGARLAWLAVAPDNEVAVRLYESLGYRRAFERSLWIEPAYPRNERPPD